MEPPPRSPSQTALLTAAARAMHREEPPPWVLDDRLALELAGEAGSTLLGRLRSEIPADAVRSFSRWVCVRARLPEDVVEKAMAEGVRQYVILGAGLDSFAYRRADLLERVRVFEVDHPASQAWKRRRLDELKIAVPANLVFAPVDFETQTLRKGLTTVGFDFDAPAVFSWIGVTMYLTLDAIRATLATVAACTPGSRIVLTYNRPRDALGDLGVALDSMIARLAAESGEPFLSLFEPPDIERLLRELGFDDITDFGPEEAVKTYFGGRQDVHFGGAQRLVVARVADA